MRLHYVLILCAGLCCNASGQSPYSSLQVPKQIQYQGRVATGTGTAWSGTEGYFSFALVQGATVLWNNWEGTASPSDPGTVSLGAGQVLTLPVNIGVFSIRLGEGSDTNEQIPATVFFDTTSNSVRTGVKLAVWFSPDGGMFTRLSPDVEFTSVPFAMVAGIAEAVKERAITQSMLAPTAAVPVGGVIAWCGTLSSIPEGFELCAGGTPTTNGATYLGQKPDLRGRFLRGAESSRNDVLASVFTGGSDSIATRVSGGTAISIPQLPAHSHGVNDPGHSHGVNAGGGGSNATVLVADNRGGGPLAVTNWGVVGNSTGISIQNTGQGQAHDHSVPSHDNRPAYLELFYIIRVK